MVFCCFVGVSVLVYPRYYNWRLSLMLRDRSWRGSGRQFPIKTSATLSTVSWHMSLARSFSLLHEKSPSWMAWEKAPMSRTWSSCVNFSRNSSCCRSMQVKNFIQHIHARSSLAFVPYILALSRASRSDESLPTR